MQHWQYGLSVRVQAAVDEDGIAFWRIAGFLTAETLGPVLADAAAWHLQAQALAHVADYRMAMVRVDLRVFLALARSVVQPRTAIGRPMAIVPHLHQVAYFGAYSDVMARTGVWRQVFTDYDEAVAWAWKAAAFRLRAGFVGSHPYTSRTPPHDAPPEPDQASHRAVGPIS
jgi:hypothetical protein